MNISLQSNLRFGDNQALMEFFGDHMIAHATYQRLIFATFGAHPQIMDVADPMAMFAWIEMNEKLKDKESPDMPAALMTWLDLHNQMHESEVSIIGLGSSPDLVDADFRNEGQFYDWHMRHQQLHALENRALGI